LFNIVDCGTCCSLLYSKFCSI